MGYFLGGRVEPSPRREYGSALLHPSGASVLFQGLGEEIPVWMSHGDHLSQAPAGFQVTAKTENDHYRGCQPQFTTHPEVAHTLAQQLLRNFAVEVCGAGPTGARPLC
jgi:GMP synthase (glutamine-hydrolysing)